MIVTNIQTIVKHVFLLMLSTCLAYKTITLDKIPVSSQTDSTPLITASGKRVRIGMIALSRDLEKEFGFHFGDKVILKRFGSYVFEDRMAKKWKRRVDILLYDHAKEFGVRRDYILLQKTIPLIMSTDNSINNNDKEV